MHKENPELKTNLSKNFVKDLIIYEALKNIEKRLKKRMSDETIGMNEIDISEGVAMKTKDMESNAPENIISNLNPSKRYMPSYRTDQHLKRKPHEIKHTKEFESSTINTNTVEPERPLNLGTDYSLDNSGIHDVLHHKRHKDNRTQHSSTHFSNHSFHSSNASSSKSEKQSLVVLHKAVLDKDIDNVFKDANKNFHEIINKHNEIKSNNVDDGNDTRHKKISTSSIASRCRARLF